MKREPNYGRTPTSETTTVSLALLFITLTALTACGGAAFTPDLFSQGCDDLHPCDASQSTDAAHNEDACPLPCAAQPRDAGQEENVAQPPDASQDAYDDQRADAGQDSDAAQPPDASQDAPAEACVQPPSSYTCSSGTQSYTILPMGQYCGVTLNNGAVYPVSTPAQCQTCETYTCACVVPSQPCGNFNHCDDTPDGPKVFCN
jgi:hypothetical protein